MKLRKAELFSLRIPFIEEFRHTLKARTFSDAVVVRVEGDNGIAGYGEAVPRPYVTGETVETCLHAMATIYWPRLGGRSLSDFGSATPWGALSDLLDVIDVRVVDGVIAWNAARCAFELAIVDFLCRSHGMSVAQWLPPCRKAVEYSGVISVGSPESAGRFAKRYKSVGIRTLKVKVGGGRDGEVLRAVREAAGPDASLRVDANCAYSVDEVSTRIARFREFGVECVEQPVPRGEPAEFAAVRAASSIPVMADESLVTVADAERLIAADACDAFNIRLSKCGGLGPSLAIADAAGKAGLRVQVGSQVGETAILSAAGRHFAAHLPHLWFAEGSFGGLLLAEDIGTRGVQFGRGGVAPVLRGPGFGIDVDDAALRRLAVSVVSLEG